jgi:hypothetical protein
MISNVVQNRFVINRRHTGSDIDISSIIPSASKVQVGTIVSLAFKANEAGMELVIYPFHSALKTTLIAGDDGIAGGIGAFNLTADAATTEDKLNGQIIAVADHVLIELADGSWQLFTIGSMDEGTAGVIAITGMTPFDGDNNLRSTASAGATAYVLLAEDVIKRAAGTTEVEIEVPVACGEQGVPFAISLKSDGETTEQYFGGLVEYTESRRITAPLTQH